MPIANIFQATFPDLGANWQSWIPAENISRQEWQEIVDALIDQLRIEFCQSSFGLTSGEISIHFHQPLGDFAHKLKAKLN